MALWDPNEVKRGVSPDRYGRVVSGTYSGVASGSHSRPAHTRAWFQSSG